MLQLRTFELLQINATVIAGALVFLSFNSLFISDMKDPKLAKINVDLMGALIIIPFALSSFFVLYEKQTEAIHWSKSGFIAIIATLGYIIVSNLLQS